MSEVPSEVLANAGKQMLATIFAERAKLQIQQIANGHEDNHTCGVGVLTYAQREAELIEAEQRLRDRYDDLLT
jgi:hypothetical protein